MNSDINKFLQELNNSIDSHIKVGDRTISANLYDFAKEVEFFLSITGLGGCRSLAEYWEMINNEDPTILTLLKIAAIERINEQNAMMYGGKRGRKFGASHSSHSTQAASHVGSSDSKEVLSDRIMGEFLINFGANQAEISKALDELKAQKRQDAKIEDITTENLLRDDYDVKSALERLNKSMEHGKNFVVSMNTIRNRRKR